MYVIVEVGAKQYLVKKGDIIEVEKQAAQEGKEVTLDKVLLLAKESKVEVGQPYLKEVTVKALLLKQFKGKKVVSYKYRRRKASHWMKGHRQKLSRLQIKEIKVG